LIPLIAKVRSHERAQFALQAIQQRSLVEPQPAARHHSAHLQKTPVKALPQLRHQAGLRVLEGKPVQCVESGHDANRRLEVVQIRPNPRVTPTELEGDKEHPL